MKIQFNWIKLLPSTFVLNVATLGPLGYWGKAPGTNGSLAGILFYTLLFYFSNPFVYIILSLLFVYLGIVFCGQAEILMKKHDPGEIILDEFVSIPFCFIGIGWILAYHSLGLITVIAFLLFRFFDILKPLGIKFLQRFKGGLGIVLDDLGAAIATSLSLHLIFWCWDKFIL